MTGREDDAMGIAARYNKGGQWTASIPQDVQYLKLQDCGADVRNVLGIYISTKSKYGKSASIYDGEYMINLPSHMVPTCEEMITDSDVIAAVNGGKLGIQPYTYELDAYPGQTFWGARWVDL